MVQAVLLDVDGTLVDSTYQNVFAWSRAFAAAGVPAEAWRIHRAIGQGGDRLVAAAAGDEAEERHGDEIRAGWRREYDRIIDDVRPLPGAADLVRDLARRGFAVVLASSSPPEHTERHLDVLGIRAHLTAVTTAADVADTKPAPDIVEVALERSASSSGLMIGDAEWDARSATRAGVAAYGVLTGGVSEDELLAAGAQRVFPGLPDLLRRLDETTLAAPT